MKTAIFNGKGNITVEDRPKPTVASRLTPSYGSSWPASAAPTCGSTGASRSCRTGRSATSSSASSTRSATASRTWPSGDFVISPFSWSDGTCKNCEAGFHTACVHGGFFGQGGEGDGGQAEFVRVPQADGTLVKVPGIGLLRRDDGLAARAQPT